MKRVISAFAVLTIVATAFAFKPLGQGSVYCQSTCTSLEDFAIDASGSITAPCGLDVNNNPKPVYRLNGIACEQIASGTKFKATDL